MSEGGAVEVVGVYMVEGVDPCYLVEAIIRGASSMPDFAAFTQPLPHVPRADWQVPYDEKLLDDAGQAILEDLFTNPLSEWPSKARVAFFFHDLDCSRPLRTPFGDVTLPAPSARPSRLDWFNYEAP